jgi:hypothetical protein
VDCGADFHGSKLVGWEITQRSGARQNMQDLVAQPAEGKNVDGVVFQDAAMPRSTFEFRIREVQPVVLASVKQRGQISISNNSPVTILCVSHRTLSSCWACSGL